MRGSEERNELEKGAMQRRKERRDDARQIKLFGVRKKTRRRQSKRAEGKEEATAARRYCV